MTGFNPEEENMSVFKKNLESLASVNHLAKLEVLNENNSEVVVSIENKPGKAGSLAVYHHLNNEFGSMTPEAASAGLELFGEYTEEAKANPGSHPNIAFLFKVISQGDSYKIKVTEK